MADFIYNKGREAFLGALIDADTDDIRVTFTASGYAPTSSSVHDFLDDITNEGTSTRSTALASPTITNGIFDATDKTITAVPSQGALNAIVMYKYNASDALARLICYITSYTGLPVTPNGGDITISWPGDSNKIFRL